MYRAGAGGNLERVRYELQLEQAVAQVGFDLDQAEKRRQAAGRIASIAGIAVAVLIAIVAGGWMLASRASVATATNPPQSNDPVPVQPVAVAGEHRSVLSKATASVDQPAEVQTPATQAPPARTAIATKVTRSAALAPKAKAPSAQRVSITIGSSGYEPSRVTARSGAPIRMTVGKGEGCAAGFLMPALSISKDNSRGPVSFDMGPLKPGTYTFTCGMGMVSGQLVVD